MGEEGGCVSVVDVLIEHGVGLVMRIPRLHVHETNKVRGVHHDGRRLGSLPVRRCSHHHLRNDILEEMRTSVPRIEALEYRIGREGPLAVPVVRRDVRVEGNIGALGVYPIIERGGMRGADAELIQAFLYRLGHGRKRDRFDGNGRAQASPLVLQNLAPRHTRALIGRGGDGTRAIGFIVPYGTEQYGIVLPQMNRSLPPLRTGKVHHRHSPTPRRFDLDFDVARQIGPVIGAESIERK
mmetsp:Transcript_12597/g.37162  ORF Transcript_12597/g.37162 Transcript_12597/m.37162 type:complete len:239 (-) Transcript_12597:893-1609(-)